MAKLSAVIITQNDEKLVAAAVNCAGFADAVLVVDCGSIGKTCDLAEELGARVQGRASGLAGFRGAKEQVGWACP